MCEIKLNHKLQFSKWKKWSERNKLKDLRYPGIYVIARCTTKNLDGCSFQWVEDIIYIGMTTSKNGLIGRLRQFDNTIKGKDGHGGACRVRGVYKNYSALVKILYVAVVPFPCDADSIKTKDLCMKGEITYAEYLCFSKYVEKFKQLPKFNDKKRYPKA